MTREDEYSVGSGNIPWRRLRDDWEASEYQKLSQAVNTPTGSRTNEQRSLIRAARNPDQNTKAGRRAKNVSMAHGKIHTSNGSRIAINGKIHGRG
jgi:hypothetical protein